MSETKCDWKEPTAVVSRDVSFLLRSISRNISALVQSVFKSIENARRALNAMLAGRSEEFAHYIDLAHEAYTFNQNYNNENTIYNVLYMTLFTARAYYNVAREFPAGKGFADMVLTPRKDAGNRPAVVLELKYDKSADTAIRQIKEKRYAGELSGYADKILLMGINYDQGTKVHECEIETWQSLDHKKFSDPS